MISCCCYCCCCCFAPLLLLLPTMIWSVIKGVCITQVSQFNIVSTTATSLFSNCFFLSCADRSEPRSRSAPGAKLVCVLHRDTTTTTTTKYELASAPLRHLFPLYGLLVLLLLYSATGVCTIAVQCKRRKNERGGKNGSPLCIFSGCQGGGPICLTACPSSRHTYIGIHNFILEL